MHESRDLFSTQLNRILVFVFTDLLHIYQGGMKAVIMTDTFQSAVLLGSLAGVLILGAADVGGLDDTWDYARRTDRLHFFE